MQQASETDTIKLLINSPGGRKDSTDSLRTAIRECAAPVIACLTGNVASAATAIALACDDIEVTEQLEFMVHNFTAGVGGKAHEIYAQVDFWKKEGWAWATETYGGFLTEDEMKIVLGGEDLYFNAEEVRERWANVMRLRDEEREEFEKTIYEQAIEAMRAEVARHDSE